MSQQDLDTRKFEFEQKIRLEEIELRKKEFDLRIQEQKRQRIFTPVLVSIVGGLITIMTGLVLKYYDNRSTMLLEDKRLQSSLLVKASEAKSYEEFSSILDAFQRTGFIKIDTGVINQFKKKKYSAEFKQQQIKLFYETTAVVSFLTVNNDYTSARYKEKLSRFWELYWVELSAVETPEVAAAMVKFGNILREIENGESGNTSETKQQLYLAGLAIATAINKSAKES